MCQWFAPTKLRITFETQGLGSFTPEEINRYVIRDTDGKVIALDLPTKFVLIANHQVNMGLDWTYLCWFFCFIDICRLVVCLVPHLLPEPSWHSPVCLYNSEEKSSLGPYRWLGGCIKYSQWMGHKLFDRACNFSTSSFWRVLGHPIDNNWPLI